MIGKTIMRDAAIMVRAGGADSGIRSTLPGKIIFWRWYLR
jgi:hypothetical protein